MFTRSIMLVVALLQQPGPESPAARAARLAAFDTTEAVIRHVAAPVGEVKSALTVFRRAVFYGTDDEVLHNGEYLRASCHAVDSVATVMEAKVCRGCARADAQQALDGYRRMLPSLGRGAAHCAAQLRQLQRAEDPAKRLRQDVRLVGNALVLTLRRYEARLDGVLKALNLEPSVAPPSGPVRPPGRSRP